MSKKRIKMHKKEGEDQIWQAHRLDGKVKNFGIKAFLKKKMTRPHR